MHVKYSESGRSDQTTTSHCVTAPLASAWLALCLLLPSPSLVYRPHFQNCLFETPHQTWIIPAQNHQCPSSEATPDPELLGARRQASSGVSVQGPAEFPALKEQGEGEVGARVSAPPSVATGAPHGKISVGWLNEKTCEGSKA